MFKFIYILFLASTLINEDPSNGNDEGNITDNTKGTTSIYYVVFEKYVKDCLFHLLVFNLSYIF